MTRFTFGPLPLFTAGGDGLPDQVLENETGGIFSATLNGPALPIYDFNDTPINFISSSATGQAQWRTDDQLVGWVRFGTVSVRVMSNDAGDLLQQTQAAVDQASSAKIAAESSLVQLGEAIAGIGPGVASGDVQKVVRWNSAGVISTSGVWDVRVASDLFGVLFLSTNDPLAPAPNDPSLRVGDRWARHTSAVGGTAVGGGFSDGF